MKILGIRNSPTKIRFCVLVGDVNAYAFTNCDDENRIELPKALTTEEDRLRWVISEFRRIFDKFGPFDHLAIKQNENVATRYSSVKSVMFLDCVAVMVAVEKHVPVTSQVYASLGTNKGGVIAFTESRVSKSTTHWDTQMADAIAAAIKNLR